MNPVCGHVCGPYDAVWYWIPYGRQVRDYVKNRGVGVVYLEGQQDVRDNVWNALKNNNDIVYITGCGHGDSDVYTGYLLNYIFWVDMTNNGFKPQWAKNKVFLLLSCLTAQDLGPWMVNKLGAWSYIGWYEEFVLVINMGQRKGSSWQQTPDLLFLKPVEIAMAKLSVNEITPGQAYDYIYNEYSKILQGDYPEMIKKWIKWDRDNLRIFGHKEAPPGAPPHVPPPKPPSPPPIPGPGPFYRSLEVPWPPGIVPPCTNDWIGKLLRKHLKIVDENGQDFTSKFRVFLYDRYYDSSKKRWLEYAFIGFEEPAVKDYDYNEVLIEAHYDPQTKKCELYITTANYKTVKITVGGKTVTVPPFRGDQLEPAKFMVVISV